MFEGGLILGTVLRDAEFGRDVGKGIAFRTLDPLDLGKFRQAGWRSPAAETAMVKPIARHRERRARGPEMKEADAALEDEADANRFKLRVQHVQIGAEHDVDRWADKPPLRAEFGR